MVLFDIHKYTDEFPISTANIMTRKEPVPIVFNISCALRLRKVLGQGAYGIVCSAYDRHSGQTVAIKKINAFSDKIVALRTLREIKLLKTLQHENIVLLFEVQKPASFNEFNEVYLIQEYMDADLHHVIQNQNISDDHIQYFTYQILRGLKFIHLANVIHRDLKPSNILINNDCELRICDLGLSRLDVDKSTYFNGNLTEYVATRWYRAPEIMLSVSMYSKAVDMWSVGCILAEMFIGTPLLPGNDYKQQLMRIFHLVGNPVGTKNMACVKSKRAIKYIESLPPTRPKDYDIFFQNHPNKQKRIGNTLLNPCGIDLIKHLLVFDPMKRLVASEALKHPYLGFYHDEKDEPCCVPIDPGDFDFDKPREELDLMEIKRQLFNTIMTFNS